MMPPRFSLSNDFTLGVNAPFKSQGVRVQNLISFGFNNMVTKRPQQGSPFTFLKQRGSWVKLLLTHSLRPWVEKASKSIQPI